jgi:hypothetical protein
MAQQGEFVHWTEDDDSVEIRLPLPAGTTKSDIKAVFSPTSLAVSVGADENRLLVVSHLHARIVSDETTWVIERDVMTLTLAKMPGVAGKWGASLSSNAEGSTFSCWLSPDQVAKKLGVPVPSARVVRTKTNWAQVGMAVCVALFVIVMAILSASWNLKAKAKSK